MGFLEDAAGWIANPIGGNSVMSAITDYSANTPLGGILGLQQNKMAAEQFEEQMKWEKYKFNNAHQAEVNDLKAAGLNPVLSASGGQGNAAGSLTPTAHASNGNFGALMTILSTIMPSIASLKQANAAEKMANANADKMTAEVGKINAERDIANLEYLIRDKEFANWDTKFKYDTSKTPLWIVEQVEKMFNTGANSAAGKTVENETYNLLDDAEKITDKLHLDKISKLTPARMQEEMLKLIIKLLIK